MKKIKTSPSIPEEFQVEQISQNEANIIAYPFEKGYAISLAHPLRRFLLSSSMGYAPVGIKVEGANHEFDSIRGMLEDISELIINLKNMRFKINGDEKFIESSYTFEGPKEITGSDLSNSEVEVVTSEAFLATLNEDASLSFSILVYQGIGYVPSEDIREELPEGYIPLDAYFTPVNRVTYDIENVLVEDNPTYEKIVMNIVTDGQIAPVDAFKDALLVMQEQMAIFNKEINVTLSSAIEKVNDSPELKKMLQKIDELGLSARSYNCLDRAGIHYVGEISVMADSDLKNVKNLGKKSLDEIKEQLEQFGLPVGSEFDEDVVTEFNKKIAEQAN